MRLSKVSIDPSRRRLTRTARPPREASSVLVKLGKMLAGLAVDVVRSGQQQQAVGLEHPVERRERAFRGMRHVFHHFARKDEIVAAVVRAGRAQ